MGLRLTIVSNHLVTVSIFAIQREQCIGLFYASQKRTILTGLT